MTVKLLAPIIEKEKILKENYDKSIPETLRPYFMGYPHVWKVLVKPRKSSDSKICRVNIVAAANNRTGTLGLQNLGRIPKEAPPSGEDDLRPISYYAFGTGAQTFKIILSDDMTNFIHATTSFD